MMPFLTSGVSSLGRNPEPNRPRPPRRAEPRARRRPLRPARVLHGREPAAASGEAGRPHVVHPGDLQPADVFGRQLGERREALAARIVTVSGPFLGGRDWRTGLERFEIACADSRRWRFRVARARRARPHWPAIESVAERRSKESGPARTDSRSRRCSSSPGNSESRRTPHRCLPRRDRPSWRWSSVQPACPCRSETAWSSEWHLPQTRVVSALPGPSGRAAACARPDAHRNTAERPPPGVMRAGPNPGPLIGQRLAFRIHPCYCTFEQPCDGPRRSAPSPLLSLLSVRSPLLATAMACSDYRSLGRVPTNGSDCGTLCRTA